MDNQKSNLVIDFLKAWLYIFLYALRGLKFMLIDIWAVVFSMLSFRLSKAYRKMSQTKEHEEKNVEIDYQKTKIYKEKKQKEYHYSDSVMKKYETLKVKLNYDLQNAGATRSKYPNVYKFIAKDPKKGGKIITGTMSGFSKLDINSFLLNEGYEVYDIKTSDLINFMYKDSAVIGGKMSTKDLVFWLTQLSTYIRAGITLPESVKILSMQMNKNKGKQRIIQSISYELSLGESFSNALEKQGNYFPPLLINMIKAAEATGTLQETLDDMANYYTEINDTNKEMKSAMTYPAIITVFAIAVVTFIIVYVVPQFSSIYEQSNIEVSGMTAFIIAASNFLKDNLITLLLVFALAIIFLIFAYKNVKAFRTSCQMTFMHTPVLKDIIIYKELTIFAKTFASLLRNNVYITESMDILSKITSNEVYKAILFKTIHNIIKGDKISEAFNNHWAVPDVAYYMIVTGESTGQLAEMMQKVSDYYSSMHKSTINSLKSLIEPIMIIFLAVIVAIVILSVIVPMFQMYNQIL